jgi:DNA-binding IclR family transcriptional regulator
MGRVTALQRKTRTDMMEVGGGDSRLVQGLARGLTVLRAFRPGESSLSNTEIAARTGLPKPTVSRLTQTLTALGYLSYLPRLGHYTLGAAVVGLCHSLLAGMPYRIAARPILQDLADFSRLPVSLGARDQLDMLYIETARHAGARPARFDLGSRLPIEVTAMGRAYLFGLPERERDILLDRIRRRYGRNGWRDVQTGIERALNSLAARGFCLSAGEWRPDVVGVGVPVVTADGAVLAINCGGPPFEVSVKQMEEEIGPRLAHAASLIAADGGPDASSTIPRIALRERMHAVDETHWTPPRSGRRRPLREALR